MKIFLKTGLLFLFPLLLNAQTQEQKSDSLHLALKMAANDTVKMNILGSLILHHVESNRDSALHFSEQGFNISKKLKQPLWTAQALIAKAYIFQKDGNLPLAFKMINESMAISQEADNEKNVYIEKGSDSEGDPHKYRLGILADGFHQLGIMYSQAGNLEKGITNWKKVIQLGQEIKSERRLVNSNLNIGYAYQRLNKLDSAQTYSKKALHYAHSTGYLTYQGGILQTIGDIFFKRKQPDSARYYYWKSLSANRKQLNFEGESDTNLSLAQLYQSIFQTDSMLYYANKAYAMGKNLKAGWLMAQSADLISNAFKQRGNTDSALTYLAISKTIGDSLNRERNEKLIEFQNLNFEEQMRLEKTAQENIAFKNKIKTISLFSGVAFLTVLAFVFYRNNRQKEKVNKILESTLTNLKTTQNQLIQSEKMASLGELTAGIAHEIQNPLNFVNNFSEVSVELLEELDEEVQKGNTEEVLALSSDLKENLSKINHHGKRADSIVKGMLQHSRSTSGKKELTDINALADEYLRLSYHGMRAKDKSFNAELITHFDQKVPPVNIIPQDIGRVFINLFTNAFYAVQQKQKSAGPEFKPTVEVRTSIVAGGVNISVKDNGNGIPDSIKNKIMQPFFTTKPTGQGTGLGLSLSYDIITKGHGGELKVETGEGEGAEFIVILPVKTEL